MSTQPNSDQTIRCGSARVIVRAYSGDTATISEPGIRLAVGGPGAPDSTVALTPAAARQAAAALRMAADIAEEYLP